ncbi:CPSF A subunit region domain-containing protein [Sarocladium implicatum]|nr:CPSF A subunit region domain-containing protein [Sarocladium implicatum]
MQVYTELVAPSAVTHSLALPLTSANANNLVVAKGSLLQIFRTVTISADIDAQDPTSTGQAPPAATATSDSRFDQRGNDDEGLESSFLGGERLVRTDRSQNTKLVLIAEFPLAGTVIGLARIKLKNTASGGEALLLAYKAAKLCLAEWDPKRGSLETMSIHYYEKDDLQGAPWEGSFGDHVNYLEADPGSRCAALHFGTRNLAILPFRQSEEDLEMEDWDEDLDGPRPAPKDPSAGANGDVGDEEREIAHMPSFVLRLPLLDPTLLHPVHFAFLYEYREPTFGILSSSQALSRALGQQDSLTYKVFTLDLQQKASTTILSVTGLPLDLERVIPLPGPIGGALLVGQNEIIHVDQSGKTNGVAVNPMTRQMTSFILTDQSQLGLRLEYCTVQLMSAESGELLLITKDGEMCVVSFQLDGRTVSGMNVKAVTSEQGGNIVMNRATCMSKIGRNTMFVGSDSSDSLVLGWSRKHTQEKRKKARQLDPDLGIDVDDLDLDEDDEDDDLYGNGSSETKSANTNGTTKAGPLQFRLHDSLLSLAPIREMAIGKPAVPDSTDEARLCKGVTADLQLTCAVGRGKAGAIAILNREIQPKVIGRFEFPEAQGFWTFAVKKPAAKVLAPNVTGNGENYDDMPQYDRYMIVAKVDLDGYETSDVYALTAAGFESLKETEFEPAAGYTLEAGTMGKGMRIVQALKSEVRVYDGDLGLTQILPMLDEETGAEPRVLSASISDSHILLLREDHSAMVAQMDSNYELEEMEKTDKILSSTKWIAGCLYTDRKCTFQQEAPVEKGAHATMLFLLSSAGALHVYDVSDLSKSVFVAEGLTHAPPYLSAEYRLRRGMARDSFKEILVADLGDRISQSPYLICRHDTNDLTIYEPLRIPTSTPSSLTQSLLFKKCPNSSLAKPAPQTDSKDDAESGEEDALTPSFRPQALRAISDVGGFATVFLPEASPSFILKSAKSTPKVIGLQGLPVRGLSPFHTEGCDRGFIYADSSGIARVTQLPSSSKAGSVPPTNLTDLGISVQKVPLGVDVEYISFHEPTTTYIAGCSEPEPFALPHDDDYHKEWAREVNPLPFPPNVSRGSLRLISPHSWSVIHTQELESCEAIHAMKSLTLETSEDTHERRPLLAVGSGISKGEDLPTRGRVQVFDIVTVIPQPGRPETNRRLKQIACEDIPRGGVTALSHIGNQGLLLIAQGQKCMVRGLKEDGSLLPVAFLDMGCHVASARELPRSGLCLMADAFKGVWFAGYTEEPYTFKVLGKSSSRLPLLVADFLPDGEDLSIVAADADGELHILEFNPAHRGSLEGQLLLHNSTFAVTPNHPTFSLLLPTPSSTHTLLLSSPTGHISSLLPLPESSYRRLLSLSNQLLPALTPYGGLNPKAHRMGDVRGGSVGVDAGTGRGVVDGAVLARWMEVAAARRVEVAGKVGYEGVGELREELRNVLGWSNLSYF